MRVPRGRVVQALTSGLDILAGTLGGVASGKQRRRPQQGGDGKGEGEFSAHPADSFSELYGSNAGTALIRQRNSWPIMAPTRRVPSQSSVLTRMSFPRQGITAR
jgi:hypothetical protein